MGKAPFIVTDRVGTGASERGQAALSLALSLCAPRSFSTPGGLVSQAGYLGRRKLGVGGSELGALSAGRWQLPLGIWGLLAAPPSRAAIGGSSKESAAHFCNGNTGGPQRAGCWLSQHRRGPRTGRDGSVGSNQTCALLWWLTRHCSRTESCPGAGSSACAPSVPRGGAGEGRCALEG